MGQTPLKLVFMGTPDLAATVLAKVLQWEGGRVEAVYCQPDRPAGRGYGLKEPPVKVLARERNLPIFQPLNFKATQTVAELAALRPDYLLVAAYGLILPQAVLDIPTRMPLNVHTSLLPRYRGAAPIQRSVMNGDAETGVTIMRMEAGLDTGPIILQRSLAIGPRDTAATMHDALAILGGDLLIQSLEALEAGSVSPVSQNESLASHAAKLTKADGRIDFTCPAGSIDAQVRGVTPWPGAWAEIERVGQDPLMVAVISGQALDGESSESPGTVLGLQGDCLAVSAGHGSVYGIRECKPAGKKSMPAAAFANGYLAGSCAARFRLYQPKQSD